MKTKNLCLVAAVLALSVVVGLLTPSGTAHAQPPAPHYTCYNMLPPVVPPTLPPILTLETQFGIEDVTHAPIYTDLCLPTIKNGEGNTTDPHVECLPITGKSPVKIVNLTTQFGVQKNVEVGSPIEACMPATKAIYPDPPPPLVPPVPHYECFQIHADRPSGLPPTVILVNQFAPMPGLVFGLGDPTRLCLPAIKNEEGAMGDMEGVAHVECFGITGPAGAIPPLNLRTQFDITPPLQENVAVGIPKELCVPALKEVLVGGIAEAPDAEASSLGATDSGGSSGTTYAVIAGIAAGALMLGAGGWYARRRRRAHL